MDNKYIPDLDAMLRLSEIMNDTEKTIQLGNREFKVKALRAGTQWLIAQEACKIAKANESFTDIIKQFATNIPAVVRVLCLAVLNDKDKIYGPEYEELYNYILWEVPRTEWISLIVECLQMLSMDNFFVLTGAIDNFRNLVLTKRPQQS